MSDSEDSERFIGLSVDSTFVDGEGTTHVSGRIARSEDISTEEAKEVIAEKAAIDPERISIHPVSEEEFYGRAKGRRSVGFSKWNSSWDPKAPESDPNMN